MHEYPFRCAPSCCWSCSCPPARLDRVPRQGPWRSERGGGFRCIPRPAVAPESGNGRTVPDHGPTSDHPVEVSTVVPALGDHARETLAPFLVTRPSPLSAGSPLASKAVQDIEAELSGLGPLARVLVRKMKGRATSPQGLRELLAPTIQSPRTRDFFLEGKLGESPAPVFPPNAKAARSMRACDSAISSGPSRPASSIRSSERSSCRRCNARFRTARSDGPDWSNPGLLQVLQCRIRPASMVMRRSQRAAIPASCVTSTSVVPCSRFSSNISVMTVSPVAKSRLPVGSSASRTAG